MQVSPRHVSLQRTLIHAQGALARPRILREKQEQRARRPSRFTPPRKKPFIGSTSDFADRGSLALDGVPPLAHHSRRATDGPVAARGSFWQLAARAYALPDIRLPSQDSATRPEASPYRTPLPERSKLGSDGFLVRGSPAHLLLPMRTRLRDQRGQRPWWVGLA
jgi:hypothetical protein